MKYREPTRAASAPGRHVLVYDGDCAFCTSSARFVQRHAKHDLRLLSFDELPDTGLLHQLTDAQRRASAHLITPDGIEYHGSAAVTRSLRLLRFGGVFALLDLPGLSVVRDLAYALIAANRGLLSRACLRQIDTPRTRQ